MKKRRVVLWKMLLVNQYTCYIAVRRTTEFVAAAGLRNKVFLLQDLGS